jgi:cyanate permease
MSNFLRTHQTNFQSGCTSLQSHQQWRSVPLSPHPHQHLLSLEILILAILTDVRLNLRVVLVCISLMIKDVEHFFRCFSSVQYSPAENSLFSSVPCFLMGLFDFLESTLLRCFFFFFFCIYWIIVPYPI